MIIHQQHFEVTSWGKIKLKIPSGVALCEGFDRVAIWVETPEVMTLSYHDADAVTIDAGLPVDNNLTIPQLQSICTQLSLSTEGTQQELIDRIKDHLGI